MLLNQLKRMVTERLAESADESHAIESKLLIELAHLLGLKRNLCCTTQSAY